METLYGCCCGLDVHAQTIVACVIRNGRKEVRTFGAMTAELLQLSDWLQEVGCTHVAMESTGVYWKPVFNILEGVLEVILVNAQHIKAVPGRKTDVKDCEWIADLLRHGLLRASFIPPLPIRELRELVRYRAGQVKELATTANRIQKVAESGNIKLGQVASDVMGVSGRRILRALAGGATTPELVSELVQGKLKRKQPAVCQAVNGRLTAVQRWVLTELLDHYEELEAAIDRVKTRIQEEVSHNPDPWVAEAIQLLDTIPGVGEETAQVIVAEIGVCMDQFPSAAHLASWAAMCPGNYESAGKRLRGTTRKGNRLLRVALVQAAWATTRTKTFLAAQYRRWAKRMGSKKALVAVGHSILVMAYHILKQRVPYQELGADFFDRQQQDTQRRRLIQKLEALGLKVTVENLEATA
ncbi:MAG TPA: IS110 family transposase [Acidobacteriota bacterium]|nr:IS110 family transposase [Acidobacteriota bacterium]